MKFQEVIDKIVRDKEPKGMAEASTSGKASASSSKGGFDLASLTASAKALAAQDSPKLDQLTGPATLGTKRLSAGVVSAFDGAAKNMKAEGDKLKDKLKESEEKLKELGKNLKELPLAQSGTPAPCDGTAPCHPLAREGLRQLQHTRAGTHSPHAARQLPGGGSGPRPHWPLCWTCFALPTNRSLVPAAGLRGLASCFDARLAGLDQAFHKQPQQSPYGVTEQRGQSVTPGLSSVRVRTVWVAQTMHTMLTFAAASALSSTSHPSRSIRKMRLTELAALTAGLPAHHHRCISGRMDITGPDYGARFAPAAAQPDRGDSEPACRIKETGAKGMGVFAAEEIERGRWVCRYIGTVVTDSDESDESDDAIREPQWDPLGIMPTAESTSDLPRVDPGSDYVLALCPGLCLDARHSDHFSRYINHDEYGNLQCSVSVEERRADFFAGETIQRGSMVERPPLKAP